MTVRSREELVRLLSTNLDPQRLPTNDITAFSQTSPNLSGTITVNTPEVDPSRGLVELPTNLVDPSGQIGQNCAIQRGQRASSFIITGRGSLPPSPLDMLTPNFVQVDLATLPIREAQPQENTRVEEQRNTGDNAQKVGSVKSPTQIVEAQGWVKDANGDVVLVATAPTANPHSPLFNPASCSTGREAE